MKGRRHRLKVRLPNRVFWVAIFAKRHFIYRSYCFSSNCLSNTRLTRAMTSRFFILVKIKNRSYHAKMRSFEKILTAQLVKRVERLASGAVNSGLDYKSGQIKDKLVSLFTV